MVVRILPIGSAIRPLLAAVLLAMTGHTASAAPDSTLAAQEPCPTHEQVFLSKGYGPPTRYGYRLIVHDKLDYSVDATDDASWVIETFDRKTGRVVTKLLLYWWCPNGRANCAVSAANNAWNPGPFDEVELDAEFKPARGAPYAIVIPGFTRWTSAAIHELIGTSDLQFLTKPKIIPDLSDQLVWISSCLCKP